VEYPLLNDRTIGEFACQYGSNPDVMDYICDLYEIQAYYRTYKTLFPNESL
jgi:hypothetical protein